MSVIETAASEEWWRPSRAQPQQLAREPSSHRSALAFWALLYFMFSLLIAPQTIVPGLDALHLAAVAVAIAVVAHVVSSLRARQSIVGTHPAVRWAAALAGWALLTAPFSYWPGGTIALLFDLYFKSLVIFWLLGVIVDTRARLKQIAVWITLLTIPISVTALKHFVTGAYVAGGSSEAPRIIGYDAPLTANPNDLALVLCMMLPIAGALAAAERNRLHRLAFLTIAALDVAAVVITFSRTGFLTLAALGLALLVKLGARSATLWGLGIVGCALAALPFLPDGYLQHMGTITAIDTDPTGSAQTRWSDTLAAAGLVLDNPLLGAGAGMSVLALNEARGASWVPVHNVYLEYATDLGLPGLVLFLLLLGACLRVVMRVVREVPRTDAGRDLRCLAQGVQLMLVAFVVAGFFHPVAYHFHFYYAGGLAAALAVVWENERGSITSDHGVRQRAGDWWDRTTVRQSGQRHRSVEVSRARGDAVARGSADG
jgi:putative inorganic carbon (hco3(-)) transporter